MLLVVGCLPFLQCATAYDAEQTEGANASKGPSDFAWHVPGQSLARTLANLARSQGLDARHYFPATLSADLVEGSVVAVTVGGKKYAIAAQTFRAPGVPGITHAQAVLLTPKGRILDRIPCQINSRYGTMKTEILATPAPDGACAVIRFLSVNWPKGDRNWWHAWHTITLHDRFWTFTEDEREANAHSLWNRKGLCRIGIADGKFTVLFPKLKMLDLSRTRWLRVFYRVDGKEKELLLDDAKLVSELLKTIVIKGRREHYPERGVRLRARQGLRWSES